MKGYLTINQIEYVLYHLGFLIDLDDTLRDQFVFLKDTEERAGYSGKIIFPLSNREFNKKSVKWIDNIPVLFPLGDATRFFTIENTNMVFSDDILKSAFYLLSGYQELQCMAQDKFGRFPYAESIQYQLNIVDKPVVNYYFSEIIKGIKTYCEIHKIPFRKKKSYFPFGLILSHDIDKIEKYKWGYIGYKIKELSGLVKREKGWCQTFRLLIRSLIGSVGLLKNNNPYWSFDYIMELNDKFNFKSTYFFLPRGKKYTDADYDLAHKKMLDIYKKIVERGDEIGIHGTFASVHSADISARNKSQLEYVIGRKVDGIRQHRLGYKFPVTTEIHQQIHYKYDMTLGFAEHIGFRNSYCLPFKLYNFEEDTMFTQWQIPLLVMDVTLFAYQKLSFSDADKAVEKLMEEVQKFEGLFTLLWHNTSLDKDEIKGIGNYYTELLTKIAGEEAVSYTGNEAIQWLEDMK